MVSFVSPTIFPRPGAATLPLCSCGLRRYRVNSTRKRWHMSTNDRFTEFSLNSTPDPFDPSNSDSSKSMDWNQWSKSGESTTIPAIPFPPAQVFMPGELKQLHLFEARYLALFETVVVDYDKKCAHVLIDSNRKAMAASGTTIAIKSWRRLEVGVSVDLEGVGRLRTVRMKASAPFLRGEFQSIHDEPLQTSDRNEARHLEKRFWSAFHDVIEICIKLGVDPIRRKIDTATPTIQAAEGIRDVTPTGKSGTLAGDNKMFVLSPDAKRELFRQKVKEAARRAVNHENINFEEEEEVDFEMLERRVRGLSFAGWDFFPSQPGMRQKAIEQRNTITRFTTVVTNLEEHCRKLAAKLALQDALSDA